LHGDDDIAEVRRLEPLSNIGTCPAVLRRFAFAAERENVRRLVDAAVLSIQSLNVGIAYESQRCRSISCPDRIRDRPQELSQLSPVNGVSPLKVAYQ
jgi:hypothetical protein